MSESAGILVVGMWVTKVGTIAYSQVSQTRQGDMMFRTAAALAILLFTAYQAQAEVVTVQPESVFSAIYSDDQALVGFYASENKAANYALCDLSEQNVLSNCQTQSSHGFVATTENMVRLRFQFEHHLQEAYRLVQLGNLPSVTNRYAGTFVQPKTLGADINHQLIKNGGYYRQTLQLSARASSQILSLTPETITTRQQTLLNPDNAPNLNLDVVAGALKISMEQM